MRVKELQICNKKVIQIYLKQQEIENTKVKQEIEDMRNKNINIVLFVSGDNAADITIKKMVNIMKNIAINS